MLLFALHLAWPFFNSFCSLTIHRAESAASAKGSYNSTKLINFHVVYLIPSVAKTKDYQKNPFQMKISPCCKSKIGLGLPTCFLFSTKKRIRSLKKCTRLFLQVNFPFCDTQSRFLGKKKLA